MNRNIAIFISSLLLVGLVLLAVFAGKKAKANDSTSYTGGGNTSTGNNNNSSGGIQLNYSKLLKRGSRGEEVKELQRHLNKLDSSNRLVIDGIFGRLTEAALKKHNKGLGQTTLYGLPLLK